MTRTFPIRTHPLLLLLLLASLLLSPSAQAQAPQPTPGTTVSPESGGVGTAFTFTYDGWGNSEDYIAYWLIGPGTRDLFEEGQFDNVPDSAGRTVWQWTAPSGVWTGTWTMYARGLRSGEIIAIPFFLNGDAVPVSANSGVTPASGTPGTRFEFFTDAWPQGDVIDAWVLPPDSTEPAWLGRLYGDPDENGFTRWRWEAPPGIYGGTWTMNARGYYSRAYVQIPIEIIAPPPVAPVAQVEPATVAPGATVSFYATGYKEVEEIAFWVNAPNSDLPVAANGIEELYSDEQGAVRWTWQVPSDAVAGTWLMTAQGRESYFQHQIAFTVAAGGQPATDLPAITVSPAAAVAGTRFEVTLTGFDTREQVQYWFSDPTGATLAEGEVTTRTNALGVAVWVWDSPPYAMPGQWTITAIGTRNRQMVQGSLTITGASAEPPGARVTPDAGTPGTTLSFYADGFEREEPVSWWATAPDRRIYPGLVDQLASRTGVYTWTWTIPADALAGDWQMVVLGNGSRTEYRVPFRVLADGNQPPPPDDSGDPIVEPTATPPAAPAPPAETPPATAPMGAATPGTGAPGDTFTFRVEGYRPATIMTYWLTAPNRRVYPNEERLVVDAAGVLAWTWTAPEDAARGQWQVAVKPAAAGQNEEPLVFYLRIE